MQMYINYIFFARSILLECLRPLSLVRRGGLGVPANAINGHVQTPFDAAVENPFQILQRRTSEWCHLVVLSLFLDFFVIQIFLRFFGLPKKNRQGVRTMFEKTAFGKTFSKKKVFLKTFSRTDPYIPFPISDSNWNQSLTHSHSSEQGSPSVYS